MDVGDQVTPPSVLKVRITQNTICHVCKCKKKTGQHSNHFGEYFLFIIERKFHSNTVLPNVMYIRSNFVEGRRNAFFHWPHFSTSTLFGKHPKSRIGRQARTTYLCNYFASSVVPFFSKIAKIIEKLLDSRWYDAYTVNTEFR